MVRLYMNLKEVQVSLSGSRPAASSRKVRKVS